ncbi:MAG: DUF3256 family protein [Muribaculaceae bacterium]|nr:DUF3256 family protein [Muribaculaceae bacterium]
MIRKLIIKIMATMAVIFSAIVPAYGAEIAGDSVSAGDVFVNLPLKTLDILSRSRRMDMLDYYAADSIYKAPNGMEGLSELVKVTPDYLKVKITPVTDMDILMLRSPKKALAVVLYTIGGDGQAADTDVTFLDDRMQELPRKKYLEYPDVLDFFNLPDKEVKEKIEEIIPFPTIEFTADPSSTTLSATLTVGEFLGKENFEYIKRYMKTSPLQFRWNGKKYEPVK